MFVTSSLSAILAVFGIDIFNQISLSFSQRGGARTSWSHEFDDLGARSLS